MKVAADGKTLTHRQILTIVAGLALGLFLAALDQTIVSTALPHIVGDLGGVDQLVWVVVAYLLATTASTPLWGKLADLYGRRAMFLAAIVIFLAGSVLCGVSQTMGQLVAFRALQGIGGGGLLSVPFVILGDVLSPRQRGRYMGYFTTVFATAGIAGPLAGGFITDHLSWRWIFYINIPPGLIGLAVTASVLRLPFRRVERKLDWFGAALLVAAVVCLVVVAVWAGEHYGWTDSTTIAMLAAGIVLAGAFVSWEQRAAEPILPLRLFRYQVVPTAIALAFCVAAVLYSGTVFLPLFLQGVTGSSATNSGLLLAPVMVGVAVSSTIAGRVTSRTGRYKPLVILGGVGSIAVMAVLTRIDAETSRTQILISMVGLGLTMGLLIPVTNLAAQNAVPMADLATTTSSASFARSMGSTLGVAVFGAVLNSQLGDKLDQLARTYALPAGTTPRGLANSPDHIRSLDEPLRTGVRVALADSISAIYAVALIFAVLVLACAFLLRELPLRDTAPIVDAQRSESPADPPILQSPRTV